MTKAVNIAISKQNTKSKPFQHHTLQQQIKRQHTRQDALAKTN